MQLLISMLPFYLMGNFHCLGMCGPLVMIIGQHRYRYWYFLGRLLSYGLAGAAAGGAGALINVILKEYQLGALTSFIFGGMILVIGISGFLGWKVPAMPKNVLGISFQKKISTLLLKDKPEASFLFGFLTVSLPCGQTMVVFSACALSGDLGVGLLNGLAFALLTSPSLFISMSAYKLMGSWRQQANQSLHLLAILVGILAICRGLAEFEYIPHLVLSQKYHVVIF